MKLFNKIKENLILLKDLIKKDAKKLFGSLILSIFFFSIFTVTLKPFYFIDNSFDRIMLIQDSINANKKVSFGVRQDVKLNKEYLENSNFYFYNEVASKGKEDGYHINFNTYPYTKLIYDNATLVKGTKDVNKNGIILNKNTLVNDFKDLIELYENEETFFNYLINKEIEVTSDDTNNTNVTYKKYKIEGIVDFKDSSINNIVNSLNKVTLINEDTFIEDLSNEANFYLVSSNYNDAKLADKIGKTSVTNVEWFYQYNVFSDPGSYLFVYLVISLLFLVIGIFSSIPLIRTLKNIFNEIDDNDTYSLYKKDLKISLGVTLTFTSFILGLISYTPIFYLSSYLVCLKFNYNHAPLSLAFTFGPYDFLMYLLISIIIFTSLYLLSLYRYNKNKELR